MRAEKQSEGSNVHASDKNVSHETNMGHVDVCGVSDDLGTSPPQCEASSIMKVIANIENKSAYMTKLLESIDKRLEYLEQLFCTLIMDDQQPIPALPAHLQERIQDRNILYKFRNN
ncbi:hypothetical protein GCK32_009926 [Trichostrongylus colubriformis]|uniref:Uncharacterized protein n=1 Tax=Trichostrongylus colubriformis TaxID=6319 RepID=A0AAN8G9E8_TRICO